MSEEEGNVSAGEEETPKAGVPWVPLILILLVIPIVTIAVMQFVVVPKLASTLAASLPAQSSAAMMARVLNRRLKRFWRQTKKRLDPVAIELFLTSW